MTTHTPRPWTAVSILSDSGGQPRLQFEDDQWKYHVWLERETLQPRPTPWGKGAGSVVLYANPLDGTGGETRLLKALSKRWAPVVDGLLGQFDLRAERQRLADEVRRAEEQRAEEWREHARRERERDLAPEMAALLRDLSEGVTSTAHADTFSSRARALLARLDVDSRPEGRP